MSNALLRPAVSSMTSKWTSDGQGVALGLNNAFMSLGRIIGPVWAGFFFDFNLNMPYLGGALIMLVGFLVSLIWLKKSPKDQPVEPELQPGLN
ncbi:MAG: MFS transporter [Anaerolineales bacterium]|nr:MFS transporter [Anaerolineales bacterium]